MWSKITFTLRRWIRGVMDGPLIKHIFFPFINLGLDYISLDFMARHILVADQYKKLCRHPFNPSIFFHLISFFLSFSFPCWKVTTEEMWALFCPLLITKSLGFYQNFHWIILKNCGLRFVPITLMGLQRLEMQYLNPNDLPSNKLSSLGRINTVFFGV